MLARHSTDLKQYDIKHFTTWIIAEGMPKPEYYRRNTQRGDKLMIEKKREKL